MTKAIMWKWVSLVLVTSVLMSGCAQLGRGPMYADAPAPEPGSAALYILRMTTAWFGYPINRYRIDGKDAAKLTDREFTWVQVSPGRHTIEARGYSSVETIEVDVQSGERRYIVFDLPGRDHGRPFFRNDSLRLVRVSFSEVPEAQALKRIQWLTYSVARP